MAEGHFNVSLTALVVVAVLIGSQLGGSCMSKKAKPRRIKQLYAVALIAIAIQLILGVL